MIGKKYIQLPFFLLVLAIFLGLTGPRLFAEGMFMDGLTNASISRNMSTGLGSFWTPHYTNTLFPIYYENPPLALWLQGLWFKLFGDSLLVERFYSFSSFILSGFFIIQIWKVLTGKIQTTWIPLLLWVVIPIVTWSCANNLLENTMSVFVCCSAWLYLGSKQNKFFLVLAGLSLSMAFLSKGPVAAFIWTFPFFEWLLSRKQDFVKMAITTITFIAISILPVVLMYVLSPAAKDYFDYYFYNQVIWNSQHTATVSSRFWILGSFLQSILIPVAVVLIVLLVDRRKPGTGDIRKNKQALLFFLVSLSGVLPIMISVKQSAFYVLSVYPFFAIALALLIPDGFSKVKLDQRLNRLTLLIASILLVVSLGSIIFFWGKPGRDKQMLDDCRKVIGITGNDQTISICPSMFENWPLHGYFARYGNISLAKDSIQNSRYFLSDGSCKSFIDTGFRDAGIDLQKFRLYIRK